MPRVVIPVTEITRDTGIEYGAVAQVTSDATNDHYIAENDGRVFIEIENENASSRTVEIVANPAPGGTFDGLTISNLVLTIPGLETWFFGPFRPYTFQQDSSGMMYLNPSASTDLKFRAYLLPVPGQA